MQKRTQKKAYSQYEPCCNAAKPTSGRIKSSSADHCRRLDITSLVIKKPLAWHVSWNLGQRVSLSTQHVSPGMGKCKRMLGHFAPPDAFDKYLTWAASSRVCRFFGHNRNYLLLVKTWPAAHDHEFTFKTGQKLNTWNCLWWHVAIVNAGFQPRVENSDKPNIFFQKKVRYVRCLLFQKTKKLLV